MSFLDAIKKYYYVFILLGIVAIVGFIFGAIYNIAYLKEANKTSGVIIKVDRDWDTDYYKLSIEYENKFIGDGVTKIGRISVPGDLSLYRKGNTVPILYDKKGRIQVNTFQAIWGVGIIGLISSIIIISIGIFGLVLRKRGISNEEVIDASNNIFQEIRPVASIMSKILSWIVVITFIYVICYVLWIFF